MVVPAELGADGVAADADHAAVGLEVEKSPHHLRGGAPKAAAEATEGVEIGPVELVPEDLDVHLGEVLRRQLGDAEVRRQGRMLQRSMSSSAEHPRRVPERMRTRLSIMWACVHRSRNSPRWPAASQRSRAHCSTRTSVARATTAAGIRGGASPARKAP